MKKLSRILLCSLALSLLLTGCGAETAPAPETPPPADVVYVDIPTVPPITPPADIPLAPPSQPFASPDPLTLYAPVLEEIRTFVAGMNDQTQAPQGMLGIWEAAMAMGDQAMDQIGFLFRDLDADDSPELLIGAFAKEEWAYTGNEIYALYTLAEGLPVPVLEGSARSAYSLTEENNFFHHGSNGAAFSISGLYRLEGTQLICEDYYFTYPDESGSGDLFVYHNTSGDWDPARSEKLDITPEELWTMDEAQAQSTAKLTATPLSQLELPAP